MSVSLYIENADGQESIPIAGQSEISEVWMPIIVRHELVCLEQCITGGLSIDPEIYSQTLEEVAILKDEFEARFSFSDEPANIVFRCRRLHRILSQHPPDDTTAIYIG
jgi:hypothetical protein